MNTEKVHWGILGTADIARKNWLGILNSGNGVVAGVASRNSERARNFIEQCQTVAPMQQKPRAFGSYEELLATENIEAVYIPLPTGLRKEWVLRAARAGKHVVCEKPCAATLADLREMLDLCAVRRVQFMDGVMFMHSARLNRIQEMLDDRTKLGTIRRITSSFTFQAPPEFFQENIRAHPKLEPHGCLGDLGWYCIRLAVWSMGGQMPRKVAGRILACAERPDSSTPVITEFSGELLFDTGASAVFFCSFLAHNSEWALVSGTQGYVRLEDFVVPFAGRKTALEVANHQFLKSGCEFEMRPQIERIEVTESSHAAPDAQESVLFRQFGNQIRSGHLNANWPQLALKTQAVMHGCLAAAREAKTLTLARDGLQYL
jgi:predicted dehydrogenase